MGNRLKNNSYFQIITQVSAVLVITILSIVWIKPIYGAESAALVSSINDVSYTPKPGVSGRLNNLNTQNYNKWVIGSIKIDNNSASGYTISFKSEQAVAGSIDTEPANQLTSSSRMVHELYRNTSEVDNHRFVEGAFIEYDITVLPKGITTQTEGSPQLEGYNNDNSANDYTTNNIHGCYADKTASYTTLTATSHDLFIVEKPLEDIETMTFNLGVTPCISRSGGVTATYGFEYDLLITTIANKKLLSGNYEDTIHITLTDI